MPFYRVLETHRSTDQIHTAHIERARGRHPDQVRCSCGWGTHSTIAELRKAIRFHFDHPEEWKRFDPRF